MERCPSPARPQRPRERTVRLPAPRAHKMGRAGALEGRPALAARGGCPGPGSPGGRGVRLGCKDDALLLQLKENEHP
ncbi:unnamed protein product [Rangifer tarandus platyrhynchus]|uniref:Uncharacterized protein n=2 Tax=Rangifer tarandus platyrhynchus TaxID=3082113 RepID=A0ACB0DU41_RANTA|nr:unnamed protein product [Rangifer tarandus platyrhynchus]CAI9691700.1 unnamed protein product [Rangifer tarandus platyrhynchus]